MHFCKAEQPLFLAHAVIYPELQRPTTLRLYAAVQPSYTGKARATMLAFRLVIMYTYRTCAGLYIPSWKSAFTIENRRPMMYIHGLKGISSAVPSKTCEAGWRCLMNIQLTVPVKIDGRQQQEEISALLKT